MPEIVFPIYVNIYQDIPYHSLNTIILTIDISGEFVFFKKFHGRILARDLLPLILKFLNSFIGPIDQFCLIPTRMFV